MLLQLLPSRSSSRNSQDRISPFHLQQASSTHARSAPVSNIDGSLFDLMKRRCGRVSEETCQDERATRKRRSRALPRPFSLASPPSNHQTLTSKTLAAAPRDDRRARRVAAPPPTPPPLPPPPPPPPLPLSPSPDNERGDDADDERSSAPAMASSNSAEHCTSIVTVTRNESSCSAAEWCARAAGRMIVGLSNDATASMSPV